MKTKSILSMAAAALLSAGLMLGPCASAAIADTPPPPKSGKAVAPQPGHKNMKKTPPPAAGKKAAPHAGQKTPPPAGKKAPAHAGKKTPPPAKDR